MPKNYPAEQDHLLAGGAGAGGRESMRFPRAMLLLKSLEGLWLRTLALFCAIRIVELHRVCRNYLSQTGATDRLGERRLAEQLRRLGELRVGIETIRQMRKAALKG